MFFPWQSLVYIKHKPHTLCGYISLLHTLWGTTLSLLPKGRTPLLQSKGPGKSLKNRNRREWERAVAYSSRLRPLLTWRRLLACAFYFSYIASDFQYPSDKSIPLSRSMGARTKRQVSFNSIHTIRKSKAKELKPYCIIEPVMFMPQCHLILADAKHMLWTSAECEIWLKTQVD